jgi:hypothetical protein
MRNERFTGGRRSKRHAGGRVRTGRAFLAFSDRARTTPVGPLMVLLESEGRTVAGRFVDEPYAADRDGHHGPPATFGRCFP